MYSRHNGTDWSAKSSAIEEELRETSHVQPLCVHLDFLAPRDAGLHHMAVCGGQLPQGRLPGGLLSSGERVKLVCRGQLPQGRLPGGLLSSDERVN